MDDTTAAAAAAAAEGPSDPVGMSGPEARRLARSLTDLLEAAHRALRDESPSSPALDAISAHLEVDYDMATLVTVSWPLWHHVSVHRGVAAYLADVSPDAQWIGVSGTHREHNDLMSVLSQERGGRSRPAKPDYLSAPCGPAETEDVISFGIVCTHAPSGAPVVLVMRMTQLHGPTNLALEALAAERHDATAVLEALRQSVDRHDVLRGQVLSFGVSEDYGNSLVTFLPRPQVSAADVVLPAQLLERVEAHVAGTAEHAERLRAVGVHLKRGLLLHGPPGTGKTHLVRYLIGHMTETTVVVLSGASLNRIEAAAALARKLAPTLVVVEDVDLIAEDRSYSPTGNPMLFSLLDAMDGVAADADVAFVLTTNRVADLERALVQRPGRVDLAVEIPVPDAAGRRALLTLYGGSALVTADLEPAVSATEGATASAMKELMRRAVLRSLARDAEAVVPVVDDAGLADVLTEFAAEHQALSRSLLGGGRLEGSDQPGRA